MQLRVCESRRASCTSGFKYKCELLLKRRATNHTAHATTAIKRFHRPQSSLRHESHLHSGRGRFFRNFSRASVPASRPIVAVIEADARDRHALRSLLSPLDAEIHDFDSAESYLADHQAPCCLIMEVALP